MCGRSARGTGSGDVLMPASCRGGTTGPLTPVRRRPRVIESPGAGAPGAGRLAAMATAPELPTAAATGPARPRRGPRRRLLDLLSLLVIVAVFGLVLPRVASYQSVGAVLGGLDRVAVAGVAVIALWNLVT